MKYMLHGVRDFGPYLLVELLLPGGTLIALLMWLFRRHYRKGNPHVEKSENTRIRRALRFLGADGAGGLCRRACA
jgi:hypothetical protein